MPAIGFRIARTSAFALLLVFTGLTGAGIEGWHVTQVAAASNTEIAAPDQATICRQWSSRSIDGRKFLHDRLQSRPGFLGIPGDERIREKEYFRARERAGADRTRYCLTSSTRRFFARPSSVSFGATGASGPVPAGFNRAAAMPCLVVSSLTTAAARRSDSAML